MSRKLELGEGAIKYWGALPSPPSLSLPSLPYLPLPFLPFPSLPIFPSLPLEVGSL